MFFLRNLASRLAVFFPPRAAVSVTRGAALKNVYSDNNTATNYESTVTFEKTRTRVRELLA